MDGGPNAWFECDICGRYAMDSWTYIEQSSPNPNPADWSHWNLTRPQRAVLSQRIRRSQESRKPGDKLFTIAAFFERFDEGKAVTYAQYLGVAAF